MKVRCRLTLLRPSVLHPKSHTLRYLSGAEKIEVPKSRRRSSSYIEVVGATEHNLKGIDVRFPLGVMNVVTGVSGSGKSTLVRDILYRGLLRELGNPGDAPGSFKSIRGDIRRISSVEFVDQNPIGKSSRKKQSNRLGRARENSACRKRLSSKKTRRPGGPTRFSSHLHQRIIFALRTTRLMI